MHHLPVLAEHLQVTPMSRGLWCDCRENDLLMASIHGQGVLSPRIRKLLSISPGRVRRAAEHWGTPARRGSRMYLEDRYIPFTRESRSTNVPGLQESYVLTYAKRDEKSKMGLFSGSVCATGAPSRSRCGLFTGERTFVRAHAWRAQMGSMGESNQRGNAQFFSGQPHVPFLGFSHPESTECLVHSTPSRAPRQTLRQSVLGQSEAQSPKLSAICQEFFWSTRQALPGRGTRDATLLTEIRQASVLSPVHFGDGCGVPFPASIVR